MKITLKHKAGFTLIETLVAILIIVISFMAALAMQARAIEGGGRADDITVAAFLAESKIEEFLVTPAGEIKGNTILNDEVNIGRNGLPGGKFSRFSLHEEHTPTALNDTVTVRVTWNDMRGKPQSVVYTTVLIRDSIQ